MKARVNAPSALFYPASDERARSTLRVLERRGIRTVNVSPDDLGSTVSGRLTGRKGETAFSGEKPQKSCLVLSNFSGKSLDALLAALREADARPGLVAVVTDSNRDWTLCALIAELSEEDRRMNASEP